MECEELYKDDEVINKMKEIAKERVKQGKKDVINRKKENKEKLKKIEESR